MSNIIMHTECIGCLVFIHLCLLWWFPFSTLVLVGAFLFVPLLVSSDIDSEVSLSVELGTVSFSCERMRALACMSCTCTM